MMTMLKTTCLEGVEAGARGVLEEVGDEVHRVLRHLLVEHLWKWGEVGGGV